TRWGINVVGIELDDVPTDLGPIVEFVIRSHVFDPLVGESKRSHAFRSIRESDDGCCGRFHPLRIDAKDFPEERRQGGARVLSVSVNIDLHARITAVPSRTGPRHVRGGRRAGLAGPDWVCQQRRARAARRTSGTQRRLLSALIWHARAGWRARPIIVSSPDG